MVALCFVVFSLHWL